MKCSDRYPIATLTCVRIPIVLAFPATGRWYPGNLGLSGVRAK